MSTSGLLVGPLFRTFTGFLHVRSGPNSDSEYNLHPKNECNPGGVEVPTFEVNSNEEVGVQGTAGTPWTMYIHHESVRRVF